MIIRYLKPFFILSSQKCESLPNTPTQMKNPSQLLNFSKNSPQFIRPLRRLF